MDVFFNKINLDLLKNKTLCPYSNHIYNLLKAAENNEKCHVKIERNVKGRRVPKKQSSKYFDMDIQKCIHESKHTKYDCLHIIFHNRHITINFVPLKEEDEGYFLPYVKYLVLWFKLMNMICPNPDCNRKLTIDIYLSNFKKKLSNNPNVILDSRHVNSAFTYPCIDNGVIMIYRKEEWFKVLLHECIHSFCLDFSLMDQQEMSVKLSTVFGVYVSSPRYSETYAELWAEILQCAFAAYFESNTNIRSFSLYFDFYTQLEFIHSVIVAMNIMKYMGISFSNMREKKHFNQRSHVYEYYILKTIVMSNLKDFFSWCLKMNGDRMIPFRQTSMNCNRFCDVIIAAYTNPMFNNSIQKIGGSNEYKSLRMSIVEVL